MPGVTRIGPKRPIRLYLAEWRTAKDLTQEQLGSRLDVEGMTISRWERGESKVSDGVMAALAEALGIHPTDLWRHPDQPSADALLRDQPREVRDRAIAVINALRGAK